MSYRLTQDKIVSDGLKRIVIEQADQAIEGLESQRGGQDDAIVMIGLIDRRRGELQGEATCLGERIYAERPRAFTDRLQVYWQGWRSDRPIAAISVR